MNKEKYLKNSLSLLHLMQTRRSIRSFSQKPVPREVVEHCIHIAASAPSGANCQPWTFVLVSNPGMKKAIRSEAEKIEKTFYEQKITGEWKKKLEPLHVNFEKPFLEEAPYLICIFMQRYGLSEEGRKIKYYYPNESVGIATGFLLSALHQLGLGTLTYTPAPITFLNKILNRPPNEKGYMIIPVGYPDENYKHPELLKKDPGQYLINL